MTTADHAQRAYDAAARTVDMCEAILAKSENTAARRWLAHASRVLNEHPENEGETQ